jgi:hypothetical protein
MSAATFTPGPWDYHSEMKSDGTNSVTVFCPANQKHPFIDYGTLAFLPANTRAWDWQKMEEQEANARLIAAAPDLLAALELLIGVYSVSHSPDTRQDCWDEAREAIAQARGQS